MAREHGPWTRVVCTELKAVFNAFEAPSEHGVVPIHSNSEYGVLRPYMANVLVQSRCEQPVDR